MSLLCDRTVLCLHAGDDDDHDYVDDDDDGGDIDGDDDMMMMVIMLTKVMMTYAMTGTAMMIVIPINYTLIEFLRSTAKGSSFYEVHTDFHLAVDSLLWEHHHHIGGELCRRNERSN